MRWWMAGLILFAAGLTGCAGDGTYELRGTFTEDATQDEMDKLQREVEDRGGDVAFLESHPVQFHATGLDEAACEEVRSFAQDADYVQEVGECQAEDSGGTY